MWKKKTNNKNLNIINRLPERNIFENENISNIKRKIFYK